MSQRHGLRILKKVPYGNCKVLNPDGQLMFRCAVKKLNWYLKRELATQIDQNTIQLLFEPKGNGRADDEFYLAEIPNKCVVCGNEKRLTRHHVVPHGYKKYFPEHLKTHMSYDVLILCTICHNKYEELAEELRNQLASEYNAYFTVKSIKKLSKVRKAAFALKDHKDKMPLDRQESLLQVLKDHCGKTDITNEDILKCTMIECEERSIGHGQAVVSKLDDLDNFIKKWRQHFVSTMNPQHLPIGWKIDRSALQL